MSQEFVTWFVDSRANAKLAQLTMDHILSYEGIAQIVRESEAVWHAADSYWMGDTPLGCQVVEVPCGIAHFSPADLVVSVRGGTRLSELQRACADSNLCLPLGRVPLGSTDPTLGEALGLALPHTLESTFGTWREWVLGMTVVLGDGVVAKSGCRAVKSVAGYDAHKLFIGARGAFGVIAEVTLRLYPKSAVNCQPEADWVRHECGWIYRCLRTDFLAASKEVSGRVLQEDPTNATLWGHGEPPTRREHDWLMRSYQSSQPNVQEGSRWLDRAKNLLDPERKLNPGQFEALL